MSEKDLANVEDVEIEPLTDSDLESVSGGAAAGTNTCPTTSGCPSTTGCPPVQEVE
jgi:hypothetical protein